jgi:DNA-directed RNA polymerase subunit RPC12/RpoP
MAKSYIKCKKCSHKEILNKHFFIKIIGGVVTGFGFWAWVAFLFAGTGFALPICIAIVVGGVGIAAFSDEIAEWVSSKYSCPTCQKRAWSVVKE